MSERFMGVILNNVKGKQDRIGAWRNMIANYRYTISLVGVKLMKG